VKRSAIYSSSTRRSDPPAGAPAPASAAPQAASEGSTAPAANASRTGRLLRRNGVLVGVLAGALIAAALFLARDALRPGAPELTQDDIDAAVINTLETKSLPSRPARAAEMVRQSVVLVRGYAEDETGADKLHGTGSGVVIVEDGLILTNLHVVYGARRVMVTFHDGLESEAELVGVKPETDLAVIRAKSLPDDLPAATLGSTQKLRPGDEVVAVGFPFAIGPSVSAGVISGLNREFRSPEGKRVLTRLIQFDAAANPGSSGGPLVTMDGEVVGIVTAILNPTEARTFLGIGFAVTIEAAGNAVGIPPF